MKNYPVATVEVTRGPSVESTHLVDIVIADARGAIHSTYGEAERMIFPRSSNKALQALPLVESGAADAFGLSSEHLAIACASHNGQAMHVNAATQLLEKAGLGKHCLECGAQLPKGTRDRMAVFQEHGGPKPIHNNCSGKHAGMLAFAAHSGFETKGYIGFEHPVQKAVAGVLEEVTGAKHGPDNYGLDGCSIPTFEMPLANLAIAFAKLSVGEDGGTQRSKAMIRLRDACMKHPELTAGDKRVCTQLMQALPNRVMVKVGAEGVYTASLPELGLGIAMKARDGNFRAVEVAVSTLCFNLLEVSEHEAQALQPLVRPILKNWNGLEVGEVRLAV